MKRLTTLNGKINRRWFNARAAKGEILIFQTNYNDAEPTYKQVEWMEMFRHGMHVYESDNNKIRGCLGTSFYYRFFIK
jgi:hypothetical protein